MTLSLTVISYAGRTPPTPVAVTLGEQGGVIGRLPGCDWVLEDPEGHVSKRHCRIDFVSGRYRITDTSTNGVYLNDGTNRIGFGVSAVLNDGDRLFIGSYDIAVQVLGNGVAAPAAVPEEEDPFGLGRYQEPAQYGEPDPIAPLSQNDRNAAFFDSGPLTREPEDKLPSSEDWLNLPTPDHAPIEQLAFQPPPVVSPSPPVAGNGAMSGGILPSNWNPLDDDDDVEAGPAVSPVQVDNFATVSPPPPSPPTVQRKMPRVERGVSGESSSMDLVQAFLEGAGLGTELLAQVEPEAVLHAAGQRLRELVSGMRALLLARAQIKTELRVEQTMIAALDNNPLKLSVDDEEALIALLTPARQGYLAPDVAVPRSFHDLKAHELALLAGARSAVAEALAPLAPELLMSRVKGSSLLAASKKAKYWELYEAEFKKLRDSGEDDPHGALSRALARAYEDQEHKQ
ncbi:MAG: type VI secretion system-associated FHA domain protein TagH [Aliidongia sp.]